MAPLGALSQAWVSAEASLPLGWQLSGLYRFDELWIGLAEGPEFDNYASGSGRWEYLAPERLREPAPGAARVGERLAIPRAALTNLRDLGPDVTHKLQNCSIGLGLDGKRRLLHDLGGPLGELGVARP